MTTARDLMTPNAVCVRESDTVNDAAQTMAREQLGALPVCGEDNRLKGMLTDRDIVVKVIAEGKDPRAVHAGELAQGEAVTIGADDDVAEILQTMSQHRVQPAAGDRRPRPGRRRRTGGRRPRHAEPGHRGAGRGAVARLLIAPGLPVADRGNRRASAERARGRGPRNRRRGTVARLLP